MQPIKHGTNILQMRYRILNGTTNNVRSHFRYTNGLGDKGSAAFFKTAPDILVARLFVFIAGYLVRNQLVTDMPRSWF